MKAVFALGFLAALSVSSAAFADTVELFVFSTTGAPNVTQNAGTVWSDNPTSEMLTVKFAGKTCSLVSSKKAGGTGGCNYTLEMQPDGKIGGQLRFGNAQCTQSAEVASSCK